MNPIDSSELSLDYLLENEVITILSWDYVIEHGTNWDEVELEEITRCNKDYMCYRDDMGYPDDLSDYSGLFSGVLYEIYYDLTLIYYMHYKDGLKNGVEVEFYSSGKIKNYCVWNKNRLVGKLYEWYENGMIKKLVDYNRNQRIEFNEQGKITKQGKA